MPNYLKTLWLLCAFITIQPQTAKACGGYSPKKVFLAAAGVATVCYIGYKAYIYSQNRIKTNHIQTTITTPLKTFLQDWPVIQNYMIRKAPTAECEQEIITILSIQPGLIKQAFFKSINNINISTGDIPVIQEQTYNALSELGFKQPESFSAIFGLFFENK